MAEQQTTLAEILEKRKRGDVLSDQEKERYRTYRNAQLDEEREAEKSRSAEREDRIALSSLGEKLGHALTKYGAARAGEAKGVDVASKLDLKPTDWQGRREAEQSRLEKALARIQGEQSDLEDFDKKQRTQASSRMVDPRTGDPLSWDSAQLGWVNKRGELVPDAISELLLRESKKEGRQLSAQGFREKHDKALGKGLVIDVEDPVKTIGEIPSVQVRKDAIDQIEKFNKIYEQEAKDFGDKDFLSEIASGDYDGVKGSIDTIIARTINGEKGAMNEGDVQRANLLKSYRERAINWFNEVARDGKLTDDYTEKVNDLLEANILYKKKWYNMLANRRARLLQESFPPQYGVTFDTAKRMLAATPLSAGQGGSLKDDEEFTPEQEALIKKNMEANPDYTREEIIEALGDQLKGGKK